MQTYVTTKLVQASPMSKHAFYKHSHLEHLIKIDPENIEDEEGYLVENTKGISNHDNHKGHIQWLSSVEFLSNHVDIGDISEKPLYQQRVIAELAQLNIKLFDLQTFTKTDQFLKLEFVDRDLLQEQCRMMARYSGVLTDRLLRWGV